MGFFSDLLGKTGANEATQLGQRSMGRANSGYDSADSYARQGYDASTSRYQPYAAGGQAGWNAYQNAMGMNGAGARQQQFDDFQSSPFLAYARQNSTNENNRIFSRYNANGMGNSGASALAVSRAAGERAQGDVNDYMNRLQGLGSQGLQIAKAQSDLDQNYYGGMADRAVNRSNALNGIDANATMAANNARMQGAQNVLGAVGAAAQLRMGMPPTALGGIGKAGGGGYTPDPRRPWS